MDDKTKPGHSQGAGLGTRVVWGGEQVQHPYNATQTPIVVSAAYGYQDIDEWYDVALGKEPGFIYSRMSNPTVSVLEDKLCELESAESAVAFSTGMAAIIRARKSDRMGSAVQHPIRLPIYLED